MTCTFSRGVRVPVFCSITIAVFLFSSPAFGKDLYVNASTGSDSYTWTQNDSSHPWATLTRACALAIAGDTVYVLPGTYTGAGTNSRSIPAFNPTNSGTSENLRITFIGTTGVVLQTDRVPGPIIGAVGKNYITWKNFVIDEANHLRAADSNAVVAWSSDHVTFDNIEIIGRNMAGDGTYLHQGIRVEGATFTLIKNCKIHGMSTGTPNVVALNTCGILMYNANNTTIENNEIYNTSAGIFIKSNSNYVTIRYNYLHDLTNSGIALTVGHTNTNIYQNIIANATMGFYVTSTGSSAGSVINNNTVVNSTDPFYCSATFGSVGAGPVTYYNNILYGGRCAAMFYGIDYTNPVSFHHNNHYGYSASGWYVSSYTSQTFAQWQAGVGGGDAGSVLTNPLFVNPSAHDYRLQAGSPARTASSTGGPLGAYITGSETIGTGAASSSPMRSIGSSPVTNVQ